MKTIKNLSLTAILLTQIAYAGITLEPHQYDFIADKVPGANSSEVQRALAGEEFRNIGQAINIAKHKLATAPAAPTSMPVQQQRSAAASSRPAQQQQQQQQRPVASAAHSQESIQDAAAALGLIKAAGLSDVQPMSLHDARAYASNRVGNPEETHLLGHLSNEKKKNKKRSSRRARHAY